MTTVKALCSPKCAKVVLGHRQQNQVFKLLGGKFCTKNKEISKIQFLKLIKYLMTPQWQFDITVKYYISLKI